MDDVLASLVVSVIMERPLCLACIATKVNATQRETLRTIERVSPVVRISVEKRGRCRACGGVIGPIYSVERPD
jgi:hypothetical protein